MFRPKSCLLSLILRDGHIPRPYMGWRWTQHSRDGRDEQLTTLEDKSTNTCLISIFSFAHLGDGKTLALLANVTDHYRL